MVRPLRQLDENDETHGQIRNLSAVMKDVAPVPAALEYRLKGFDIRLEIFFVHWLCEGKPL